MQFDDEEIQEFITEAEELLQDAENHLLVMESEVKFAENYAAVFRAFHSLKGASGMLGLDDLREHMHKMEGLFYLQKDAPHLTPEYVTFFLSGVDASRALLRNEKVEFNYQVTATVQESPVKVSTQTEKKIVVQKKHCARIYIIDDEEDILEILSTYITRQGHQPECFTSPEAAIARCREISPDLVLSDMKMPGLSGLDVLKILKEIDSEIPIIFISGYLDKETLVESLNLGAFSVLEKPIKENLLLNYIRQALTKREMLRLINRSIDLILFQCSDLERYLLCEGKKDLVEINKQEVRHLLDARRALRNLK